MDFILNRSSGNYVTRMCHFGGLKVCLGQVFRGLDEPQIGKGLPWLLKELILKSWFILTCQIRLLFIIFEVVYACALISVYM